ncbi:hypothetical protein Pint_28659 [Pistacia integerrima]|uniref:Uncharacterized protein n=1 Tax=Pistacia integerrima TaxID=434235 RepID=A0ACC0YPM5_9ROSI|nr:hypothetical protein Pint_28659 [Pistacia integerrima]
MCCIKPHGKVSKSIFSVCRRLHNKANLHNGDSMASLLKSRSVVRFSGPETIKFLQGLLTIDVLKFGEPPGEREKTSTSDFVTYKAMFHVKLVSKWIKVDLRSFRGRMVGISPGISQFAQAKCVQVNDLLILTQLEGAVPSAADSG